MGCADCLSAQMALSFRRSLEGVLHCEICIVPMYVDR